MHTKSNPQNSEIAQAVVDGHVRPSTLPHCPWCQGHGDMLGQGCPSTTAHGRGRLQPWSCGQNHVTSDLGCQFLFQEYPFLGPCFSFLPRIPQDSFGFLFFPEEFFHRNLLLAGVRKFRFLAMLTGILHRFLYIPAFDLDSCKFLRNPLDSSGIPPEFLFPPKDAWGQIG